MPATPAVKNLTAKAITKAIRAAGIDAELIRGRDHWYYDGPAVEWAYTTTAGVYRLNHRSMDQWIAEAKRFAEDSDRRRGLASDCSIQIREEESGCEN